MVRLQPADHEDLDRVLNWNRGSGPEFLMQWAGPLFHHPLSADQLFAHWGPVVAGEVSNTRLYRTYDPLVPKQPVGVVELGSIDRQNRSARVARFLIGAATARGKGIGTAALSELLEVAFGELSLNRVSLAVFDFNDNAIRCYERCGFRKEGLMREARRMGEEYWSYYEMAILRREWSARSAYA